MELFSKTVTGSRICDLLTHFWANVPMLYLLKTGNPGVFSGYKMGALDRNVERITENSIKISVKIKEKKKLRTVFTVLWFYLSK